jgi:hypothetical protein
MCDCTCHERQLKVGDVIYGFCGGEFGSSSYGPRLVIHVAPDWVVYREDARYGLWVGNPADLVPHTTPEEGDWL